MTAVSHHWSTDAKVHASDCKWLTFRADHVQTDGSETEILERLCQTFAHSCSSVQTTIAQLIIASSAKAMNFYILQLPLCFSAITSNAALPETCMGSAVQLLSH